MDEIDGLGKKMKSELEQDIKNDLAAAGVDGDDEVVKETVQITMRAFDKVLTAYLTPLLEDMRTLRSDVASLKK